MAGEANTFDDKIELGDPRPCKTWAPTEKQIAAWCFIIRQERAGGGPAAVQPREGELRYGDPDCANRRFGEGSGGAA